MNPRKFILMTSNATPAQANLITNMFDKPEHIKVWHWVDNVWLLVYLDPYPQLNTKFIWGRIKDAPELANLNGVCFETHCAMPYWGNNPQSCWEWLASNWNPPDRSSFNQSS